MIYFITLHDEVFKKPQEILVIIRYRYHSRHSSM